MRLLPGATILAIEYHHPTDEPPPGVHPRILDCLLERDGRLEVWDWKSKMRLDKSYWGESQRAALHSWQLLDYAWHAREWFGKPVGAVGQGIVVLGPSPGVLWAPVTVSPERLDQWHWDAQEVWALMDRSHMDLRSSARSLWRNWEACTDKHLHFGKECVFVPACHQLNGDESRFSAVYKRKEGDDESED